MRPGAEFSNRFAKAGIYPFTCPLHPGMVGTVIVGDAAAAAALSEVGAGTAPAAAPVGAPTSAETGDAPVVPAALGAAGGGIVGLLAGLVVSRRRPGTATADTVRTSPALDG
jgi:hypothetical protein